MFSSRRLIAWALAPLASALSIASAAELPLEPSRRVSFGVEEGTWMSLDVSPGGDRLVFDLLGDLYTLPIQGGEATRITSGTAFDTQPRYAPDGRQVVFVSDRSGHENLWTIDAAGGEPRPLTREADFQFISPAWAPDGRSLVVVKRASGGEFEAGKLWRYGLDGAGKSLVAGDDHADLNALGPWFSPSASEVYLSYRHGGFAGYNQRFPLWQVGVFDLETGELFPLTNRPGSGLRPLVSPDGRWLVYATRHDADTGLRLRDLRTGHERWLAHPVQRDNQESIASLDLMPGSAFTPDSRALITSFQGRIWRVALPSGEIEQIPFRARVDQGLGALVHADRELEDGPLQVRQIRFPRLSPDGSRLAFTALDRLWVMEMPGGEPRRLTSMQVSELQPAWSPDGTTLVYVSWSDRDGGHLYRVPADGSAEPTRLTREASFYTRPAYSPDGHHVVFVRGPRQVRVAAEEITARTTAQGLELRWLPAEGGESHFIMRAHGFGRPHFAGSSDRVFLYQGAHGLVSTRLDGSERRVHVEVNGYRYPGEEASPPAWDVLMGPGRRQAIAWDDSHVYWFALPAQAAEVPAVSLHEARESALPVRRLTTFGGEFMDWAQGGKAVSYALGRTVFTREIDAVNPRIVATTDGSLPVAIDSREKGAAYQGESVEVRLEVPRARPRGSVVLRGARLITMNGEEVIESGDVLIEDHRIAAIGRAGSLDVPAHATPLDCTGTTILPGFIDSHAHVPLFWGRLWGIHHAQVWELLANLAYGVTALRDPQTETSDVLAYSDRVEAGHVLGPRIFSTGPGIFRSQPLDSRSQALDILRRYSDYYDTLTIKQYRVGSRLRQQWVALAARELELAPTTEGGDDLELALTQILDGYSGIEHSFPVVPVYRDVVELAARSDTTYTPTLIAKYGGPEADLYFYATTNVHGDDKLRRFTPHHEIDATSRRLDAWFHDDEHDFRKQAAVAAAIVAAGGRVALGAHGEQQGIGVHWEMWALASGGMPAHQVLRAATLSGAEAIGLSNDLGSLEAGKLADLVVLEANPLDDIRNTSRLRYVVKNGEVFEADTLDRIWPERRPLPPPYWWGDDPGSDRSLKTR